MIKELGRHHHLVLPAVVCDRGLPLILEVKSLVFETRIRSSNSVGGWSVSLAWLRIILRILLELRSMSRLLAVGPHFAHEVALEHCLAHLLLIYRYLIGLMGVESSDLSLVEHLLFFLIANVGEHFGYPGVVGGLKHDASLGGVHIINYQRAVRPIIVATLALHPVGHEERLVRVLTASPVNG